MPTPLILHTATTCVPRGGVQGALENHARLDAGQGLRARFVGYFDPAGATAEGVGLAGHGWETVGALRRRFAAAATEQPVSVAVYHDGWGVHWFAPLDGAARRVVFLHTETGHIDALIRQHAPRVDGFLTVSRALAARVRQAVPDFPPERIQALAYAVESPVTDAARERLAAGPVRFGYAGRIRRDQKRMERLPALIAELDRRGVDYAFDVLGEGDYLPELQRQLHGHARVHFLPWRQGADYWRTLASWRAIVLLSDFEGFSRAMMEGMMAGALPVHPDFSPAAAELVGPAAAGLYPVGDMAAAAERLAALATMDPAELAALRHACRAHLAPHTPENYFAAYGNFLKQLLAWPARARPAPAAAWQDHLLLGVYTRLFPRRF